MFTVPVAAYSRASAVMNSDDATRLIDDVRRAAAQLLA